MTNQSIIAVPPDLSDQTVLRRFLSLLVERVDVAVGNRNSSNFLAAQAELLSSIANAKASVEAATLELEEAIQRLDELGAATIEDINAAIDSNAIGVAALNNMTALTACAIRFSVDGLGEPNIINDFNIASGVRLSTGLYEFTLTTAAYKGVSMLAGSFVTTSHSVQSSVTTDLYAVAVTQTSVNKFTVGVYAMTKSPSSNAIVASAIDMIAGDEVNVVHTYKLPGSLVPL